MTLPDATPSPALSFQRTPTAPFERQSTAMSIGVWPAPAPTGPPPPRPTTPAAPVGPPPAWLGTASEGAAGAAVGSFETAGQRGDAAMEDADVIICNLAGAPGVILFAVFDGHRGPEASFFLRDRLQQFAEARWSGSASAEALLSQVLLDADAAFGAEWMARVAPDGGKPARGARFPGSTALAALVYPAAAGGWRLAVANVGDSRAVLCQDGQAVALTSDHTGKRLDERERVHKAGATVRYMAGAWRFGAAGLAVTRSVGDTDMKHLGLCAEAETCDQALDGTQSFLILASDGVWDVFSNEDGVALLQGVAGTESPQACAERLVKEAMARGSTDNVSAVVALLPQAAAAGP